VGKLLKVGGAGGVVSVCWIALDPPRRLETKTVNLPINGIPAK
jgi:hypothetical protein